MALIGREALFADPRMFGLSGRTVGRPDILGFSTQSDGRLRRLVRGRVRRARHPGRCGPPQLVRPTAHRHPRQRAGRGHPRDAGAHHQGDRLRVLGVHRRVRGLALRRHVGHGRRHAVRAGEQPRDPALRLRRRHHHRVGRGHRGRPVRTPRVRPGDVPRAGRASSSSPWARRRSAWAASPTASPGSSSLRHGPCGRWPLVAALHRHQRARRGEPVAARAAELGSTG